MKCILGAFGYFEVTHDITKYCKADIFSSIGKQTPVAVRFSTVGGESGSADTVRYTYTIYYTLYIRLLKLLRKLYVLNNIH